MNSPRPLTISNVSSVGYTTSNVAIGPPLPSNQNLYSPRRRGSNGFPYTPSATIVGGSVNFIEPQFPPLPPTQIMSPRNIVPSPMVIRPTTPPIFPIATVPITVNPVAVAPLPLVQPSNIYSPLPTATYTNLPMPLRNSIAGFSFPEMGTFINQNHFLAGGDYQKLPMDASFAKMSTKVICPQCGQVVMTNVQLELGMASYCWCLTLLPLACTGLCCLCLPECKDRIHYCSCGEVVGYNRNSIC